MRSCTFVQFYEAFLITETSSYNGYHMISRATLISTLGAEPQVVTLAFDLLRQQGHQIEEIIVLHTAADVNPSKDALHRLTETIPTLQSDLSKTTV